MFAKSLVAREMLSAIKLAFTVTKQRNMANTVPKGTSAQWSRVRELGKAFQGRATEIYM
jgi:hypothetical protein